jgi:diguanylate cyclase (GGDEF)-like protein
MPLLADTATWVAVGFAAGAAALALVALWRRGPSGDIDELLRHSNQRFETLVADLTRAREAAEEESRRTRELSEIATTIDLDGVLTRTLEAALSEAGLDAGMIVLASGDHPVGGSEPLIATVGMTAQEAARQPVSGPPDGHGARAVRIAYSYTPEESAEDGELIRGGIAVPLRDEDGEPIGTLATFWRGREREATEDELARLESLAGSAGPAIENARRFREARQLADLDALTSLHNRRYFHETLARECARAHRYDRNLALVVFDIDDFKAINDRIGHLAGDAVLASVAERVQSVVRSADVACRVGGDEFAVILPEATITDAEQLYRRVQFAVAARPIGPFDRLHLSAGIAELRAQDDARTFFERADEALYRAKEAGKGQVVAADGTARG